MKIIDSKGKLFGKVNVVDVAVIIVVLALVAGTFYKFGVLDKTKAGSSLQPITYTVEIKKIRDNIFTVVKEGDTLYDKTSGNPIGTITKIEGVMAMDNIGVLNGDFVSMPIENRQDVTLTIEAEALTDGAGDYFVNKTYQLISNSTKKIMTKYYECSASIRDIKPR